MHIDEELREGASNAINVCMNVQEADRVYIYSDEATWTVGEALAEEARRTSAQVRIGKLEDYGSRPLSQVPEELAAEVMEFQPTVTFFAADAYEGELAFRFDLGRKLRLGKPLRHGHMVGITPRLMREGMRADYREVYRLTQQVFGRVRHARSIHATSEKGSDLRAVFDPRLRWVPCHGLYHEVGEWGNLPEGEVYTCPGGLEGVIIADVLGDYFSTKYGVLTDPVRFEVEDGFVREVTCDDCALADEVWTYLHSCENGARAGEFAIGTNTAVTGLTGRLLQDEKIPGIHVAFGRPYPEETGADWTSQVHIDVIPTGCTIEVDGELIMEGGVFTL
jgi:aminopeptidase